MANWIDKFNKATQTAVSKSKEMAEITRLNMEISNFTQRRKELYMQIGEYIVENDLLSEEELISSLKNQVAEVSTAIQNNEEKILGIKNINICSGCGAEVPKDSRYCNKCGTEMKVTEMKVTELEEQDAKKTCPNCGEILDEGAVFCGKCGCRQE